VHVIRIEEKSISQVSYRAARSGGGVEERELPILRGQVDSLPAGLEALVVTSGLQGIAMDDDAEVLLGVAAARAIATLSDNGAIPPRARTGVLLAGDLFSAPKPDERAASGDVRPVWLAFRRFFRWVAGVTGTRDLYGESPRDEGAFATSAGVRILDGDIVTIDGLKVGGIAGLVGDPKKPRRKSPREFAQTVRKMKVQEMDVLVLHGGPDVPAEKLVGSSDVRLALDGIGPRLVVCGHAYWPKCTAEIRGGAQVLNVDSRAVVLTR
jgi:Icc protein